MPCGRSGRRVHAPPFGYQTTCDYHDVVLGEVYVDKYAVNALSAEQREAMAAPAARALQFPRYWRWHCTHSPLSAPIALWTCASSPSWTAPFNASASRWSRRALCTKCA